MKTILRAFLVVATLLWSLRAAHAMEVRDCEDPRVFRDSPVNVLLLPYTYTGAASSRPLSEAARRLGVLIQQDSLLEMVKYERIAIVNLVARPGARRCDVEEVLDRMAGPGRDPSAGVQPGGGVVVMWGRLFEDRGDLFIQSYLRFARVGTVERIERKVASAVFRAELPHDTVATPPRRISAADLRAIGEAFERAAQVRERPDMNAPVVRVSPDPNQFEPFGYYVTEVKGDWMRVGSFYGGPPGWVRARVDASSWPLRDRLPELHMLDAIVGYLQVRVAAESERFRRQPPARFVTFAERSLARYLERTPRNSAPGVAALGHAMIGVLRLPATSERADELRAAESHFMEAARLAPYSGDVRNLLALARMLACCAQAGGAASGTPQAMEALLAAVATDPENRAALQNLAAFHRVLDAQPAALAAVSRDEIARQRAALKMVGISR